MAQPSPSSTAWRPPASASSTRAPPVTARARVCSLSLLPPVLHLPERHGPISFSNRTLSFLLSTRFTGVCCRVWPPSTSCGPAPFAHVGQLPTSAREGMEPARQRIEHGHTRGARPPLVLPQPGQELSLLMHMPYAWLLASKGPLPPPTASIIISVCVAAVAAKVFHGVCRRCALPTDGQPAGLRLLRPAPPRAPGQVMFPLHRKEVHEQRGEAGGLGERDGVRARMRARMATSPLGR